MNMINIGIRLDVGRTIGLGHLMRCSSLADSLSKLGDIKIYFICRNKVNIKLNYEIIYVEKEYLKDGNNYVFPSIFDEMDEIKSIIQKYQISCVIIDHYGAGDDYFKELRKSVKTIICVDDSLERDIPVDAIINGNIYGKSADYGRIPLKLVGGQYTLLRKEFQEVSEKVIEKEAENIYITSGGADPLKFCKTMLDIIMKISGKKENLKVHVIAGNDFEDDYISDLKKQGAVLHKNANMYQCMNDADLFITSAGSTLYELAVSGVPSVSFVLAQDQKLVAEYMWKAGTSIAGGKFSERNEEKISDVIESLIIDYETRKRLSEIGQKTISATGADNAARELKERFWKNETVIFD